MMTVLQILRQTYENAAMDTFTDEFTRDLLAVLADLDRRVAALEAAARQ